MKNHPSIGGKGGKFSTKEKIQIAFCKGKEKRAHVWWSPGWSDLYRFKEATPKKGSTKN